MRLPARTNFVALARQRAAAMGDVSAYLFLENGEEQEQRLTYAQLDARARSIAHHIRRRVDPGSRVLLLYPPGLDYVAAFFACLYAGVIAVPAYPPASRRQLPRLGAILRDCGAALALSSSVLQTVEAAVRQELPPRARLDWLATSDIEVDERSGPPPVEPEAETLAMLQYTSGSTGDPKGVMLTHGNLIANSEVIHSWLQHPPGSPGVTWLPPYHDMGLIGGILQPMYVGFLAVMLSPLAFVQRPLRWLRAISRYRATVSGGPNFAYELCVRSTTPQERAELDLSCWERAFCGAEPIDAAVVSRFGESFAPSGFRRTAFFPAYGLAESTLAVTGKPPQTLVRQRLFSGAALDEGRVLPAQPGDPDAREHVSCGVPLPGTELAIVDPETTCSRPEKMVGEIWLRGQCVTKGYWNRPNETLEAFGAHTADGVGPWLRTGDFGFVCEGELYVTGRLKDLIINFGKKYSPVDIERAAERAEPRLRPGCTIAFSVSMDGSEGLVLVAATRKHEPGAAEAIAAVVRRAIASEFQLGVRDVRLVPTAAVPITSSGKVRRYACKQAYLSGALRGEKT